VMKEKTRRLQRVSQSGRRDLNSGPLVPQTHRTNWRGLPASVRKWRFAGTFSLRTELSRLRSISRFRAFEDLVRTNRARCSLCGS
jgi:hypothetical protein